MAPNATSLTPTEKELENEKPIAEPPKDTVSEEDDTVSEDGDKKETNPEDEKDAKPLPTHDDKADKGETDSKDDDEDDEKDEINTKSKTDSHALTQMVGTENNGSISKTASATFPDSDASASLQPIPKPLDVITEQVADFEKDDEESEMDEESKALPPTDSAEKETKSGDEEKLAAAFPPTHATEDNGSGNKSKTAASSDSGATIPKPLDIIPAKRSHAEITEGQLSSPESNKKPKQDVVTKKVVYPHYWRAEDEVILLKRMNKYKNKKGLHFKTNLAAFYNKIKDKFQVSCSQEQVRNKIRNLKRRFDGNKNKGVNGSDPSFSKPHDRLVFEISKKLWNADASVSNGLKSDNVKGKKILMVCDETNEGGDFWSRYSFLGSLFNELFMNHSPKVFSKMKNQMSLIESEVAKEIDNKCRQVIKDEMEQKGKMAELIIDALKRNI